ncbi:hypothetical protein [Microbulbifer taiwanensis]|uniref:Uncharacterized protein n=1 Tax=Microbulbifer taiwanensis TaxID=986746 RepID=A0ABW1YLL2_9GAMM|nr:hypothetical protein [Microbulbifer taiwanensis]
MNSLPRLSPSAHVFSKAVAGERTGGLEPASGSEPEFHTTDASRELANAQPGRFRDLNAIEFENWRPEPERQTRSIYSAGKAQDGRDLHPAVTQLGAETSTNVNQYEQY